MNWYGTLLALAVWAGAGLAARLAEADGVPPRTIWRIIVAFVGGGYAGGKLMLAVVRPDLWRPDSVDFWLSAGHFYGGVLVGVCAVLPLLKRNRRHLGAIASALATGVCLGQTIGRMACFQAGCCFGTPCSLPWAVRYTADRTHTGVPVGVGLHPVQLYEAIFTGALTVFLLGIRKSRHGPWRACAIYCMAYGAGRCFLESFRGDDRGVLPVVGGSLGINPSQVGATVMALAPVILLLLRKGKSSRARTMGAGAS